VPDRSALRPWQKYEEAKGRLAQLVRASALQAEGHPFEPDTAHHVNIASGGYQVTSLGVDLVSLSLKLSSLSLFTDLRGRSSAG
jgi:hypothetical protein